MLEDDDVESRPGLSPGAGAGRVADIHQRVTSLEERAQAYDAGITELRKDIASLRTEIAQVVHRPEFMELQREVAAIRADMVHRSDLTDLRREMNERFLAMDQKFTWLVGIQVAGLVAVIGALVGSYYR